MTDVPLHVQVIALMERRVSTRREELRSKCGNGLPEQQYQRAVGQIRECTVQLEELAELKKRSLEALEDEEDVSGEPISRPRRAKHRSSR